MNASERPLDHSARTKLDEYLDAVERTLADSGMSRDERQAVRDEIDAQACEMVAARAEGEPTEQDMMAVLAELDDPESYRESTSESRAATADIRAATVRERCLSQSATSPPDEPKIHPSAIAAFAIPFLEFFLMFTPFHPHGEGPMFVTWGVVSVLCIVLGIVAVRDIRRWPYRYRGTILAVFGMLAVPTMVFCVFGYVYLEQIDFLGCWKASIKNMRIEQQVRERELLVTAYKSILSHKRDFARHPVTTAELSEFARQRGLKSTQDALTPAEKLTPKEQWLVNRRPTLEGVKSAVIIAVQATVVALAFFVAYRCC